jgi:hypothetical protein
VSTWECSSGHLLEGFFYSQRSNGDPRETPVAVACPYCGDDMVLSKVEGAKELLKRIREFVGSVSRDPEYTVPSDDALKDLGRLESTVRKLADDAARP